MAKVKKFGQIQSWKKARSLTKQVYTATLTGPFAKDFGLRDQIRRAAVSILSKLLKALNVGATRSSFSFWQLQKDQPANLEHSYT